MVLTDSVCGFPGFNKALLLTTLLWGSRQAIVLFQAWVDEVLVATAAMFAWNFGNHVHGSGELKSRLALASCAWLISWQQFHRCCSPSHPGSGNTTCLSWRERAPNWRKTALRRTKGGKCCRPIVLPLGWTNYSVGCSGRVLLSSSFH